MQFNQVLFTLSILFISLVQGCLHYVGDVPIHDISFLGATITDDDFKICTFSGYPDSSSNYHFTCGDGYTATAIGTPANIQYTTPHGDFAFTADIRYYVSGFYEYFADIYGC